MTDLKITVDQLKNYLGTGLEILDGWGDVRKLKYTHLDDEGNNGVLFGIQPICYRLSDLDKEIEYNGERFVPLNELFQVAYESVYYSRFDGNFDEHTLLGQNLAVKAKEFVGGRWRDYGFTVELPYHFSLTVNGKELTIPNFTMYQKFFEWHFWPFGEEYFEQGLVIDKMKIPKK